MFAAQVSEPLLGALAEMRAIARHHLAQAQTKLASAPPEILPAFLPVALVGPQLRQMERRGYRPYAPEAAPAWRRQWLLWRAARDPRRIFKG
ncbi:MAG: squalene/phytoene synthase family protein [Pseudolabrys sp.]